MTAIVSSGDGEFMAQWFKCPAAQPDDRPRVMVDVTVPHGYPIEQLVASVLSVETDEMPVLTRLDGGGGGLMSRWYAIESTDERLAGTRVIVTRDRNSKRERHG